MYIQQKKFNNPLPVALALLPICDRGETGILMIRRGDGLGKGMLALPGGYLRPNETVEDAAKRELREECGLVLRDKTEQGYVRCQPVPNAILGSGITENNRLLMFVGFRKMMLTRIERLGAYLADKAKGENWHLGREVQEVVIVKRSNLHQWESQFFSVHADVVKAYLQ